VLEFWCRDDCRYGRNTATCGCQHIAYPAPMTCPLKPHVTIDLRALKIEPGTAERSQSDTSHAEVAKFGPIAELNEIGKVGAANSRLHIPVPCTISRAVSRVVVIDDPREVVQ